MTGFGLLFCFCGTEATITDGLLRFYRGDGDATDATGNGPTLTGETGYTDITFPQSATSRKVFDFKNTQNGLMGSSSGLPDGSNSRTMLGWFKFGEGQLHDGGRVDGDPFGYGRYVTNQNFYIDVYHTAGVNDPNRKYRVTLDVDELAVIDEGINPIIDTTATTWFHLVITYDQVSNTNAAYLNGQFLRSGQPSQVPTTNVNGSNLPSKFFIGQHVSTTDTVYRDLASYRGMVADVAIFNRVITPDEVSTIYNNDNWYLNAGGGGDPHLVGFGGNLFTWQGACTVVLLAAPPSTQGKHDDLQIHIRTKRIRKWSCIDAIALKMGGDVVEVDSNEAKLFRNGSEVSSIQTARISVNKPMAKKKKVIYNFILDGDKYVEVTANKRTQMIFLNLHGNYSSETKGILGSPANPGFFGRDGKAMQGDVNLFVEEWQINDSDPQIFRTRPFPQFPDKCSYNVNRDSSVRERRLKQTDSISMEEASRACSTHSPGPLRQYCIDDVMQTGDLEMADDKFYG